MVDNGEALNMYIKHIKQIILTILDIVSIFRKKNFLNSARSPVINNFEIRESHVVNLAFYVFWC